MIGQILTATKTFIETFASIEAVAVTAAALAVGVIVKLVVDQRTASQAERQKQLLAANRLKHQQGIENLYGNKEKAAKQPATPRPVHSHHAIAASFPTLPTSSPSSSVNMNPPKAADRKAQKLAKINADLERLAKINAIHAKRKATTLPGKSAADHSAPTVSRRLG
jgi:hypothetical protein